MNLRAVNQILKEVEGELLGGLRSTDLFNKASGMSVAHIRGNPKACALFNFLSERIRDTTRKSAMGLPDNFTQFMLQFESGELLFMIDVNDKYRWGMLIDANKASLGMAVSVVIPEALPKLKAALSSRRAR